MFGMVFIAAAALVLFSHLILGSCLSTNTKNWYTFLYSIQSCRLSLWSCTNKALSAPCYPAGNPSLGQQTCCNFAANKTLTAWTSLLHFCMLYGMLLLFHDHPSLSDSAQFLYLYFIYQSLLLVRYSAPMLFITGSAYSYLYSILIFVLTFEQNLIALLWVFCL